MVLLVLLILIRDNELVSNTLKFITVMAAILIGSSPSYSKEVEQNGIDCLAEAIYYEARGESISGQLAVANVILNRLKKKRFGKSICEVVRNRRCTFSYWCDGKPERMANKKARNTAYWVAQLAIEADAKVQRIEGATHYHAEYVNPYWSKHLTYLGKIGKHLFYKENL